MSPVRTRSPAPHEVPRLRGFRRLRAAEPPGSPGGRSTHDRQRRHSTLGMLSPCNYEQARCTWLHHHRSRPSRPLSPNRGNSNLPPVWRSRTALKHLPQQSPQGCRRSMLATVRAWPKRQASWAELSAIGSSATAGRRPSAPGQASASTAMPVVIVSAAAMARARTGWRSSQADNNAAMSTLDSRIAATGAGSLVRSSARRNAP